MKERSKSDNSLIFSYLSLRKTIGILGILFPLVLSLGALIIFRAGIQSSISSYYYTGMRNIFVGTLCVIGFFLFSYKGYQRTDDVAGYLGCAFAVGVALFPIAPDNPVSGDARLIGYFHSAFALLFFLTLIYFSLCLFTKTDPSRPASKRKLQRNNIYKLCGYTMSLCILLIVIYSLLPNEMASPIEVFHPVFWLEAIVVVAFGISWLIKGETILKDEAQFLE